MVAPVAAAPPTDRRLPNFFILGNPKSGSTFLFSCLRAGPFDPNLLHPQLSEWRTGSYLLTTLGTKKEFNFWGGPGWSYGWEWYAGVPAPLSAWQWTSTMDESDMHWRRRGENGNGDPNTFVTEMCTLNATTERRVKIGRAARSACRRFPLECVSGTPVVRPGCGLVRPFPSCKRAKKAPGSSSKQPCEAPKVRMSHAWPPTAEVSTKALLLDPSINTFMSYPKAPEQLRAHHPLPPATLRFVVILRDPLARAQSSARMMREWRWDKASNVSEALLRDLANFDRCCEAVSPSSRASLALDGTSGMEAAASLWERAASQLLRLSDGQLGRFRQCLAREAPLNHVRASIYAAGVLGWLSAGFVPSQFLWLDTETMRSMDAVTLLTTVGRFAGLPIDHLERRLPKHVRAACEHPRAVHGIGEGRRLDDRMKTHGQRALPAAVATQLQRAFKPFNGVLRTLLSDLSPEIRSMQWLA